MNPGAYYTLSMPDYLKDPALSKSALDRIHCNPQEFDEWRRGLLCDYQTDAMRFGSCLHALSLTRKTEYVVRPREYPAEEKGVQVMKPWTYRAKYCVDWFAKQTRPIVSADDGEALEECDWAIRNDPRAAILLAAGRPEVSVFAEYAGLNFKGRFDWLGKGYIVDLKTTTDASTYAFSREIAARRYHVQAALYWKLAALLGLEVEKFYLIAIQRPDQHTQAPPRVNVRELKPSAMEVGLIELEQDIATYKECVEKNEWPGLSGPGLEIGEIDIPAYKYGGDTALIISGQTVNF